MTQPAWIPEREITLAEANRLVDGVFPDVTGVGAELFAQGWDNTAVRFRNPHLGELIFRFPRRAIALPGVRRELAWLPRLAAHLPLPIPLPAYSGSWGPEGDEPWPFWGGQMLAGTELAQTAIESDQRAIVAAELGGFLRVLHDLPRRPLRRRGRPARGGAEHRTPAKSDGPPGRCSWRRGGALCWGMQRRPVRQRDGWTTVRPRRRRCAPRPTPDRRIRSRSALRDRDREIRSPGRRKPPVSHTTSCNPPRAPHAARPKPRCRAAGRRRRCFRVSRLPRSGYRHGGRGLDRVATSPPVRGRVPA